MKVIVVIILLLLITGCNEDVSDNSTSETDGIPEAQIVITTAPEQPQYIDSYQELSDDFIEHTDTYEDDDNYDDIEVTEMEDILESAENYDFEVLDILGTAGSLYGSRWENMLVWRENAVLLAEQYRDTVILNMNPVDNAVFLTFDDGPDAVNTVSVINTLIEYDVSATFFFTGENMRRHSDVVRMAHDAGFTIGLHSYSHPHFTNLSEAEIIEELNVPNDILESIIGSRSYIMRPPFGSANSREIEIIREQGYLVYLWSLDTLDWAQDNADDILRNVKEYLRPGDIILLHAFSGQARSAAILPEIIEFILSMGFEIRALPVA